MNFDEQMLAAYRAYILGHLQIALGQQLWLTQPTIEMKPNLNGDPDHLVLTIPGGQQFQVSVVPIPRESPPDDKKPVSM